MNENEIGTIVVDSAVQLHKEIGSGLLETVYEVLLAHVLRQKGIHVDRQVPVPITYHGISFDEAFRADMVVAGKVILELKSVEKLSNAHRKQLLTYLKLTDMKLGYVLNFGESLMKDGICRTINGYLEDDAVSTPKPQATVKDSLRVSVAP